METFKTDTPCRKCGEFDLKIISDPVGYMGSRMVYEDFGYCPKCDERYSHSEVQKRFSDNSENANLLSEGRG